MYCKKCGTQIKEGSKFCPKCGQKIPSDLKEGECEHPVKLNSQEGSAINLRNTTESTAKKRAHHNVISGGILLIAVVTIGAVLAGTFLHKNPADNEPKIAKVETSESVSPESAPLKAETPAPSAEMAETSAPETTAKADITYKTMYVVNCDQSITLRTNPSMESTEVQQIPLGEAVSYIEGAENGFYKISYLGSTGYALASYLSEEQPSYENAKADDNSKEQTYETMYVVNCDESITLRTSPSTQSAEVRQIPLGEAVSYIEGAENGFYKISYLGATGYALASYLSSEQPYYGNVKADGYYEEEAYATMRVANCDESITLRSSPSTKASALCQIPLGEVVSYIESAANGFYKISYLGQTGYALASYLVYE